MSSRSITFCDQNYNINKNQIVPLITHWPVPISKKFFYDFVTDETIKRKINKNKWLLNNFYNQPKHHSKNPKEVLNINQIHIKKIIKKKKLKTKEENRRPHTRNQNGMKVLIFACSKDETHTHTGLYRFKIIINNTQLAFWSSSSSLHAYKVQAYTVTWWWSFISHLVHFFNGKAHTHMKDTTLSSRTVYQYLF